MEAQKRSVTFDILIIPSNPPLCHPHCPHIRVNKHKGKCSLFQQDLAMLPYTVLKSEFPESDRRLFYCSGACVLRTVHQTRGGYGDKPNE